MKIKLLLILLFFVSKGYCQLTEGIAFEESDMTAVFAKATKENKIIFVDCYTSWCGPCQVMAKNVFTDKSVGEYFNRNFINVKIDMEKGEGPTMAKKYGVNAYPTFIFLDGEGGLVHKFSGSQSASEFIESAKQTFDLQNVVRQSAIFKDHLQDTAYVATYLAKLRKGNMNEELKVAVQDYLQAISPINYLKPFNWGIIRSHVYNYDSQVFRYVADNYQLFYDMFGKDQVSSFLDEAYRYEIAGRFGYQCEHFNQASFDSLVIELNGISLDFVSRRLAGMYAFRAMHLKLYGEYADVVDVMFRYALLDQDPMDRFMKVVSYAQVILDSGQKEYYDRADNWLSTFLKEVGNNLFATPLLWEKRIELAQKGGNTAHLQALGQEKDAFFKQLYESIPLTKDMIEARKRELTAEKYKDFINELKRLKVKIL